ncbi:MAG: alpha/beta fold hydrolase [Turicibacter sp.]
MHIYGEGAGEVTLVFMAGGGTSSPTLDFKSLYQKLSDDYRIAVVEKAGYGFSEVADVKRDIETILEETRTALQVAGEKPPYILMPHSMSGIEAIYWAKQYPDEIKGIIGLDMAVPEAYDAFKIPSTVTMNLLSFAARIGFTRFIPSICESSAALKGDQLSDSDKEIYRAIFYHRTQTRNMVEEVKQIKSNANRVRNQGIPKDTPMYLFISDGTQVPVNQWESILTDYVKQLTYGTYQVLDSGHYIHHFESDIIAKETKQFIKTILENEEG